MPFSCIVAIRCRTTSTTVVPTSTSIAPSAKAAIVAARSAGRCAPWTTPTRTDGIADYPSGNLPWVVVDGVGGFDPHVDGDGTIVKP